MMATRRRKLALCLLLVLAAFVIAGCETDDYGPVKVMQAMPESHLAPYPGATLLSQGSVPRRSSPEEGTYPAQLGREFGTNAPESAVIAYYESLLESLGWAQGCSVCSDWSKPGYAFALQTVSQSSLNSHEQGYSFVFHETLTEDIDHTSPPASGT